MNVTEETIIRNLRFTTPDYATFLAMLIASALVGIYFGCFAPKQKSAIDYLLGGKKMSILPVSMSLIASNISVGTVLGAPSEIYTYGTQYWLICLASFIVCFIVIYVYLPVFHKLQLTSTFEYLELRFNRSVRVIASSFYTLGQVLYVPVTVYLPALAFSQVSGVNLYLITPVVSSICIFYTTLGGIKAVIWTDFIQQTIMFAASIFVIIFGLIRIGGFSNMWQINMEGERIEFFNMDPSIFSRMTFLTTTIGWTTIYLSSFGVSQSNIQRFLSVPTLRAANISMILLTIGIIACKSMSCLIGLLIHAQYHDCDPLVSKVIKHQDQLLPYYVMDTVGHIPGLPGLFVAGVFSAALSTMSTILNTVSGTIYEDLISRCLPKKIREKHESLFMKIIVVLMGIFCVAMVLVVEKLGGAIQMSVTLSSISFGGILGLYSLGLFCPWANTTGALTGGLSSLIVVATLIVGSQTAVATKQIVHPKKSISVDGCIHLFNMTMANLTEINHPTEVIPEEPFILFKISFMYFGTVGFLTVIIVGIFVSWFFHPNKVEDVNRDLLSPVIYRWLPTKQIEKDSMVAESLLLSDKIKQ